jgi:hypothetical protein
MKDTLKVNCLTSLSELPLYGPRQLSCCQLLDPKGRPFRFANGGTFSAVRRAFEIQHERATAYGQKWSPEHAAALFNLHHAYGLTARGLANGRTAWPLAVGTGKSESIVAFVKAQHEEHSAGRQSHTLLVCMEQVSQLTDLYRAITSTGVPDSFVGVFHLKSETEVNTEGLVKPVKLEDASSYRVLLATHAKMMRGDQGVADVNTFEGRARDLVIWDESLIKARGLYSDLLEIEEANALLGVACRGASKDAADAYALFAKRLAVLRAAFEASSGATVEPPTLSPEDELRFSAGLTEALRRGGARKEVHKVLSTFLDHVQRPIRVLRYTDEGRKLGLIHFETLIPPSLKRLIVLDASHNIRALTGEHDKDLAVTRVNCAVKSFENVTVKALKHGAGRDLLDKSLPRRDSTLMREIVEEVKSWPSDKKGLIVTFRLRGAESRRGKCSHAELIQHALTAAGVDLGRLAFITWGQHTGVNDYGDADHVLLVGVLRRAGLELASAIAGQRGDLETPHAADLEEVKRVEHSEMFHNIIQAAGRGRCRHTVNGKAQPMTLSLICNDTFPHSLWNAAMPGVKVYDWTAKHATKASATDERVKAVERTLAGLSVERVSTRALRTLAGLDSVTPNVFTDVIAKVRAYGWAREGRSFIRNPFANA